MYFDGSFTPSFINYSQSQSGVKRSKVLVTGFIEGESPAIKILYPTDAINTVLLNRILTNSIVRICLLKENLISCSTNNSYYLYLKI